MIEVDGRRWWKRRNKIISCFVVYSDPEWEEG